jgi:Flp pilus assembly pilin Flp
MRLPDPRDDRGVTSVEYALIVAAIATAIIIIVFTLGGNVSALFAKMTFDNPNP